MTATRRFTNRRLALLVVPMLPLPTYQAWFHARFAATPDRSTWWNPWTWDAGPPPDVRLLTSDLLAAVQLLPPRTGDPSDLARDELIAAWKAVPRPRVFDAVVAGEESLHNLDTDAVEAYERASSALNQLLSAGGTELPLPERTSDTAAMQLQQLSETPREFLSHCRSLTALAARQLAAPHGVFFADKLLNHAEEPCVAAAEAVRRDGLQWSPWSLETPIASGRLGRCRLFVLTELIHGSKHLTEEELATIPPTWGHYLRNDEAYPGAESTWWAAQRMRQARCGVVDVESAEERRRVLESELAATCNELQDRWSRWHSLEIPYAACSERLWLQEAGPQGVPARLQTLARALAGTVETSPAPASGTGTGDM